jgi:hypothetical protein
MEYEQLIPLVCWAAATWAAVALWVAWWIWRLTYPLETPPTVIRFEDLKHYGKD